MEATETNSSRQCAYSVTVRRNPHRRARPTPSAAAPQQPSFSKSILTSISSFPVTRSSRSTSLRTLVLFRPPPKTTATTASPNLSKIKPLTTLNNASPKDLRNQEQRSKIKNAWPKAQISKESTKKKVKKKSNSCITTNNFKSVTLSPPPVIQDSKRIKSEIYEGFSQVFAPESSQDEVYEKMVRPLVEDFLRGKSGMLAAIGHTGSGKTHTIFGSTREPGMAPQAIRRIFERRFYFSMFGIYSERGKGEKLYDLSQEGGDLFMQQSTIKGHKEVAISDVAEAESFIACGMLKRTTAVTKANSQSSRSQCIISIRQAFKIENEVGIEQNNAVLTIVDLAGAERERRTGNQSLLEHQKNPKKPLEKHFQNSLLTSYLRSIMLKNHPTSKRTIQALPRLGQQKRLKIGEEKNTEDGGRISKEETSLGHTNNVPPWNISVQSENATKVKVDVFAPAKSNLVDKERNDLIMKNFAKALWNVLKQYKKKLEVAESEACDLRQKLKNEMLRCLELDRELKYSKIQCSCSKEVSAKPAEDDIIGWVGSSTEARISSPGIKNLNQQIYQKDGSMHEISASAEESHGSYCVGIMDSNHVADRTGLKTPDLIDCSSESLSLARDDGECCSQLERNWLQKEECKGCDQALPLHPKVFVCTKVEEQLDGSAKIIDPPSIGSCASSGNNSDNTKDLVRSSIKIRASSLGVESLEQQIDQSVDQNGETSVEFSGNVRELNHSVKDLKLEALDTDHRCSDHLDSSSGNRAYKKCPEQLLTLKEEEPVEGCNNIRLTKPESQISSNTTSLGLQKLKRCLLWLALLVNPRSAPRFFRSLTVCCSVQSQQNRTTMKAQNTAKP
ncbi:Kinesin motor domain [Dillenia turbinata]|uniref:Kinesin motor domain n=1 Tax=Dillenia turbinata TaxID=194707 RepID=A0AAN8W538_9MAGN